MSTRNTIAAIGWELAEALRPLADGFAADESFPGFMWDLGWDFEAIPIPFAALRAPAKSISDLLDLGEVDVGALPNLLSAVRMLLRAVDDLGSVAAIELPQTVDAALFKSEFPRQVVDTLIVDHLFERHYEWAALLQVAGVIRVEDVPAAGKRPPYRERSIAFGDLVTLFDDPLSFLGSTYRWGGTDFRAEELVDNLRDLANAWGVFTNVVTLDEQLTSVLHQGALPGETRDIHSRALRLPFITDVGSSTGLDAGVQLITLPETIASRPGFAIVPYGHGSVSLRFPLTTDVAAFLEGDADFSSGVAALVRPGEPARLIKEIIPSATSGITPPSGVRMGFGVEVKPESGLPFVVIGFSDASRLEVSSMSVRVGLEARAQGANDLFVEIELARSTFILAPGDDADGFLAHVLPADPVKTTFTLGVGLSISQGLYFTGSSALEIQIPVHLQLGPLEIISALVAAKPGGSRLEVDLAGTIRADLGVLNATVENVGLTAIFTAPPDRNGQFGPLDLSLAFRPPNGVGVAVDAGVVKGGGYLRFDSDREEYAGALELVFSEWIALKAIGLITTKMPDGSKGFSLLIIITVEFGTGFQLGFGFTLNGVGGILGLNRIVNIDPLKEGVRTGAIESVMFPKDVVANAPRIISDLRQFFPPQQDIFLVGPMAKLGWGTPTLVTAQLGVILEFPSVNITILGVIKVVLPDEKADILRLQVNFIGRFEPANKLLWFYAELYDSRVLFITLEGGFGLLVHWGDNANFVVSAGGFHPRYSPPPLPFPEPPRIAVSILNESYAKIRIEAYFAVTSNSVQFGARAELFFGLSEFRIEGHLAFDALFQFDPFFFSFGLSVSLSVKVFGVGLFSVGFSGLLEGPTPWYIEGKGRISLLFFKISVPFKHSWGDNEDTKLDPIEVFPLLETEFAALTNWEARLAGNHKLHVSLRKLGEADTDQLVLHPVGRLRISQRKVPINFKLDKVGNKRPSDVNRISVAAALPGSALSVSTVQDQFAIGQYRDLDGSGQLSSPGYEPLDSGIDIGVSGAPLKSSRAVRRVIRYESIIIDNNFKRHVKTFFSFFAHGYAVLNDFLFAHFLNGNAVSQSVHSQHYRKRMQPFDEVIEIQPTLYSVVSTTDNQPIDAAATSFTSQAKAHEHMEQQIGAGSAKAGSLHVVPNTELNQAA